MTGYLNGWTLSYAGACLLTLLATAAERRPTPIHWARLGAWLLLAAAAGLLAWSVLACFVWMGVENQGRPWKWGMVPFCILGSAYWAAFVVAAFLPLYALLLIWYARRFGGTEVTRRFVVLASLILGVPGALWVAYANAFPVYELQRSVRLGSAYGTLALLSFWVALVSPRLLVGRLGPGQLRRLVAA